MGNTPFDDLVEDTQHNSDQWNSKLVALHQKVLELMKEKVTNNINMDQAHTSNFAG
ncbi:conserved hypothetical protein [Ricinus communis]|uniref:Uncharacterized protein n=1 Tax=Ricinus communis TaxID=3988 RepID=B9SD54_RICCO|nr:conserved hypothetical protein [Ricinus communis]